jgi:Electron transfer DM13
MLSDLPPIRSGPPRQPPGRLRPYEFVPEALLAIGLTIFLIDEPDAATSAFKSTRALVIMAVAAICWVSARLAFTRLVRWPIVRLGSFAVAAGAALAVVVVPAYDTDTVIEAFPVTSPSTTGSVGSGAAEDPELAQPPPPGSGKPRRHRVGMFRGVDHRASGTVAVYRQPDGRYVVGLENFDIQPGPDYDLYVVPGEGREDRDGGSRVDDLRGNRGTQFYEVARELDLGDGAWTVLVWCQTFGVPVATATPV